MYNEKIFQRLRAKIDSSLFPDPENGKYVLAGLGFTSSIILRLNIYSMPILTDNDIHYYWRNVYESDVVAHTGHDIRV